MRQVAFLCLVRGKHILTHHTHTHADSKTCSYLILSNSAKSCFEETSPHASVGNQPTEVAICEILAPKSPRPSLQLDTARFG